MDEGTAHLDPATESAVNKTITKLDITRIVVAHRAETIAAADRVLIAVGGHLITREEAAFLLSQKDIGANAVD